MAAALFSWKPDIVLQVVIVEMLAPGAPVLIWRYEADGADCPLAVDLIERAADGSPSRGGWIPLLCFWWMLLPVVLGIMSARIT